MDKQKKRKRIFSSVLAVLTAAALFLPWGSAGFGGAVRLGESYSNPIWVRGSYLRGAASSLREFADELNGFQEECEIFELIVMSVLIFLAVLQVIYAVCRIAGADMAFYIGAAAEAFLLLVVAGSILAALFWGDSTQELGRDFQIVLDIRLNPVPFVIIFMEIIGKNVCSNKRAFFMV